MKYQKPSVTLICLLSQDVISASFTQTEIKTAEYSENKDSINFEDLIG